ncbi:hypothetical protein KKC63_03045 [Patescibacteria group bacterium]|nr:hypothetical protein [Patescibacteria group bacterium]MBU4023371.1 hypothetical protein [Patescibacteria group bacterium]MBU4078533.1 hypothetical protein [Patescibacteria group bacterium]
MKIKLTKNEEKILGDFDAGKLKSVRNIEKQTSLYRRYARRTLENIERDIREGRNISPPLSSIQEIKEYLELL